MSDYGSLDNFEVSSQSFTTSTDYEKPDEPPQAAREFAIEPSKPALHRRPELISYSIHFTSLVLTAIVLQLSFRGVYWADEDGWKNNGWSMGLSQPVMAGLLQFCAKLHEVFIVASLSAIAIDVIRRRLLVSRGVPFGFLMGGYRFGSATSLFSGSFWGPFIDATCHGKFELFSLGLFLGLGAIYANAIGPASAVLIVPTLNWWPAYDFTTLVQGDGYMYPTSVNAIYLNGTCRGNEDLPFGCPGLGASDLQNAKYFAQPGDSANRTLTQRYGKARRNLYTSPSIRPPTGNSVVRISSTIHSLMLEAIGLGGHFVSTYADSLSPYYRIGRPQLEVVSSPNILSEVVQENNSVGAMSPIVQTECMSARKVHLRSGIATLVFPSSLLSTSNRQAAVPQDYLTTVSYSDGNSSYGLNFTWVDKQVFHYQGQNSASIGAIASIPVSAIQDILFVACVLDARWAATEISYDPGSGDTVLSNITDMSLFANATLDTNTQSKYGIGEAIDVRPEWADLLNAPVAPFEPGDKWPNAVESYLTSLLIGTRELEARFENVTSEIAKFLSLTLADGLCRAGTMDAGLWATVYSDPTWVSRENLLAYSLSGNGLSVTFNQLFRQASQNMSFKTITFKVRRYGWGYGIATKTVRVAICILFIHAAFAVGYINFAIAHWILYRWSSRSWRNMEQLFALAMVSSQPPSLRGVSAGVGTWDTWKLEVAIREDQGFLDSIELAFSERGGSPVGRKEGKLKWRKRYK